MNFNGEALTKAAKLLTEVNTHWPSFMLDSIGYLENPSDWVANEEEDEISYGSKRIWVENGQNSPSDLLNDVKEAKKYKIVGFTNIEKPQVSTVSAVVSADIQSFGQVLNSAPSCDQSTYLQLNPKTLELANIHNTKDEVLSLDKSNKQEHLLKYI